MRHTGDAGFEWHQTGLGCGTDAQEESPPAACGNKTSLLVAWQVDYKDYKVIFHCHFYLTHVYVLYLKFTPLRSSFCRADAILGVEGLGAPVRPEVLDN